MTTSPEPGQARQRLLALDTSELSDALDRLKICGQLYGVLPVVPTAQLAGRAFTVRYAPASTPPGTVGDYTMIWGLATSLSSTTLDAPT